MTEIVLQASGLLEHRAEEGVQAVTVGRRSQPTVVVYDSRGQQGVRPSRIDRRESGGRTKECLDDLIVLFRFTRAGCVNESSARRHRIGSVAKHAQLSVGKRG